MTNMAVRLSATTEGSEGREGNWRNQRGWLAVEKHVSLGWWQD